MKINKFACLRYEYKHKLFKICLSRSWLSITLSLISSFFQSSAKQFTDTITTQHVAIQSKHRFPKKPSNQNADLLKATNQNAGISLVRNLYKHRDLHQMKQGLYKNLIICKKKESHYIN